jgi:GNAT superfamily N-acetyltransferase
MDDPFRVVIQPLDSRHDRAAFFCGKPALDRYLRQQANQDRRRDVARVFVALGRDDGEIAGYYSLGALSIDLGDLPPDRARKLPHYPDVPAALIGRLAVATSWQGKGLGKILLVDALKRIVTLGGELAIHAIVVEPIDGEADAFYRKFGFLPFPERSDRLFLPTATARQLFQEPG